MLIHAFDPVNFTTCHNLSIQPIIRSPNFLALYDEGLRENHVRVEDLCLEDVRDAQFRSTLTPRAVTYMKGCMLSKKMPIEDGYGIKLGFSAEEEERLIKIYNTELTMEKLRRDIAPDAPSRLSCLWLAEESSASRDMLKTMFGNGRQIIFVNILSKTSLFEADASYYDDYFETGNLISAENYWQGKKISSKWELLLDGAIEIVQEDQLKQLLNECREAGMTVLR